MRRSCADAIQATRMLSTRAFRWGRSCPRPTARGRGKRPWPARSASAFPRLRTTRARTPASIARRHQNHGGPAGVGRNAEAEITRGQQSGQPGDQHGDDERLTRHDRRRHQGGDGRGAGRGNDRGRRRRAGNVQRRGFRDPHDDFAKTNPLNGSCVPLNKNCLRQTERLPDAAPGRCLASCHRPAQGSCNARRGAVTFSLIVPRCA